MKRETRDHFEWASRCARDREYRAHAADAIATDAENRALRAEVRRIRREADAALQLVWEMPGHALRQDVIAHLGRAALAPRPKRGGR